METSNLLDRSGSRPLMDGLNFAIIHMNTLSREHTPWENDLWGEEVALLQVPIELLLG